MEVILVDCPNTPGQLTRIAEAIAAENINITSVAGVASGNQGTIALLTADQGGARSALNDAGISHRVADCLTTSIPDRPGELAALTRKLAEAEVNVECLVPLNFGEQTTIAIGVDDRARAEKALGH